MITRKVVLVLGAGASIPFGFPSGRELKNEIVNRLGPPSLDGPKLAMLTIAGFGVDHIEAFRSALQKSGKLSVDAFLEHRAEFLEVGKAATACFLLPREAEQVLFGSSLSWYDYLFDKLNARFEEFDRNAISILTFNYDRSLEHYLFTAVRNLYGKTAEECVEKLRGVPIVHLYGQLGELPAFAGDSNAIEYGAPLDVEALTKAANGIQIIHEAIKDSRAFEQAHEMLRKAERICFLGFGYNETNLQRLMGYKRDDQPEIYGSSRGFTSRECGLIRERLIGLGFSAARGPEYDNLDALDFLRFYCPFD
jgi:hypothetical protein